MLLLALMLVVAQPPAQAPGVVVEGQGQGEWGVATVHTRLDGRRRYAVVIDGPPDRSFTARYMQVFVSDQPTNRGTGNDDGNFQATTPFEMDLLPPASGLVFWRYSLVVSPDEPTPVTVRLLDRGPR